MKTAKLQTLFKCPILLWSKGGAAVAVRITNTSTRNRYPELRQESYIRLGFKAKTITSATILASFLNKNTKKHTQF